MDIDIYGDLDNLDNQFELVQKENEQLKETVQKLEETSIKFSIEIDELKRINGNLEVNISALYKTAKAEIERKSKQIAELRKDLDNMLFKRDPKRKIPDKTNGNSQETQILTKQFEKAQYDIDQKNRIIQSLNSELENVRKELDFRNNIRKRNSSQIDENEHNFKAKKPKLKKEPFVENEEDYRKYKNRYEMRENDHYNQRSNSPNYRRYNSRVPNDLRSRIELKRINYRRSRSKSREDFKPGQYNKRSNSRQNYRDAQFKGRYTERPESPMDYNPNYRFTNTADDEKQNCLSDSGVFNSQTTESSYTRESIASESCFSVSPVLSHDDFNVELEEGELNKTILDTEESKLKKNIKPPKFSDEHKKTQEKGKHDTKRSTKTNLLVASDATTSVNKTEKSTTETIANTAVVSETKLYNLLTTKYDNSKSKQELADLTKLEEKLKNEIKELKNNIDIKKSKLVETVSCTDSEKFSKIENEKNEINETNTAVTEFLINESWEVVQDEKNKDTPKIETKKTEDKKYSELKSSKHNKEKSKSDKRVENTVSEKKSDLKSTKEKKTEATSKSRQEKVKTTEKNISESKKTDTKTKKTNSQSRNTDTKSKKTNSETKDTDTKTKKINSESKVTNISVVSELNKDTNKKERKVSESTDINIKVVSHIKPNKTKKERKLSETNDTKISIVSELQPTKIEIEKTVTEPTEANISVVSETKSAENNLTVASNITKIEECVENKSDISKSNLNTKKTETVDEIKISESTAAIVTENSSNLITDNIYPNLKPNKVNILSIYTINPAPSTSSTVTTSEKKSATDIESQNIETTTQITDRKPPSKGRRRRCVISIT